MPVTEGRSVAIGNAAQTLHPVAGQGLNLGLRDAAVLARLLARDPSVRTLATFEQQRQRDRASTVRLTDLMARAFASSEDQSVLQRLLGASLGVLDLVPPARRALAEQMMYGWR
jgi:2-octaprenyl-6-methoxyphenol hydroxylase